METWCLNWKHLKLLGKNLFLKKQEVEVLGNPFLFTPACACVL